MGSVMEVERLVGNVLGKINDSALNYVADIAFYTAQSPRSSSEGDIVRASCGSNVKLGEIWQSSKDDVLQSLSAALNYKGTDSSHPNRDFVGSDNHAYHVGVILGEMRKLLGQADKISGFTFHRGHPFYPVYWDFSYLIQVNGGAYVLVGSSSD